MKSNKQQPTTNNRQHTDSPTVSELGEQSLLAIVQGFCSFDVVGDDGALLAVEGRQSLVVTSDTLVDGVHFSDRTTPPFTVGWRAATANLSDLAAMGASPLALTVSLGLPSDLPVAWLKELYRGLRDCCTNAIFPQSTPPTASIIGGDLCRSPTLTIAITALGQVPPHQAIRRHTAKPGDLFVVTGTHGGSRAGLELLLHPEQGASLSVEERERLIKAHQTPNPRFDAISTLWGLNPPSNVAGMDSSDGLADAVIQICRASGVGAKLFQEAIPFPLGLEKFVSLEKAWDWIFYGGEDFELVLCLPPDIAQGLVEQLAGDAAIIGEVTTELDVVLDNEQKLTLTQGFQHF
ncbi:thiamine-phosphate kinase [Spirulina sp. CS-785/01]|uniref:thiamine-phosphate kinase n=1 Tax=Spirulina sp. CS-785/01 TaxID=3021716 RepID=UPI00232DE550|nr:thiamine-phosphate kinase [Spirulina sp. CS-785/01]MDB9313479.1 thiamine-phosphate kinase [Spirulina sp. CS-785/01]